MYPPPVQKLERGQRRQALIFLVVGILVLVGVVTAFVGLPFGDDKVIYYLEFTESVVNLDVGTAVRYKGVRFGNIRDIDVDADTPDKVKVTLAVDPDTPITESTSARIASATFLGPYYIELTGTRADSQPLPPGSTLPADQSALSKILASSESMVGELKNLLTNVNKLLNDETIADVRSAINGITDTMESAQSLMERAGNELSTVFAAVKTLADNANNILSRNEQQIQRIVANLDGVLDRANDFVQQGKLEKLSGDAEALMNRLNNEARKTAEEARKWLAENNLRSQEVHDLLADFKKLASSLEGIAQSVGTEVTRANRGGIEPLAQDLRAAAQALESLLKMLERNPRALLFGNKPPEITVPEPVK